MTATPPLLQGSPSVLRVVTRLNIGGPARHVLILDRSLPQHGFLCTLAAGHEEEREGSLDPGDGSVVDIPTLQRRVSLLKDLRARHAIGRLIDGMRPQIVHTHMAKAGALARSAASARNVPVILHTYHGHVLEGYFSPQKTKLFLAAERRLAENSDALVAVSTKVRDDLLELGIGKKEQWHVVPLGLDLELLLAMSEGVRRKDLVVGIVGRLVDIKDHRTFLAMAKLVSERLPSSRFAIIGDGDLRQELEREADRTLPGKVEFRGWVNDLEGLYRSLDVVVLTSRNEGTPVALIEASAAAKPLVATDVGGVSDVVRHGETGLLAPAGESEMLASHVVRLLESEELRSTMGAAGRAWVGPRFGSERLVEDIARLYKLLLARKGLATTS